MKIRYLDNDLYKRKYVEAYQLQLQGDYQRALTKFLEVREMGFTNFELLYSISWCCIETNSISKCSQILNFMKSKKYQEDYSQQIQLIEKEFKKIDISQNQIQGQFNTQNYCHTLQNNILSDLLDQFWNSSISLGHYELFPIILNKSPNRLNFDYREFTSNYLNYKYKEALSILQKTDNENLKQDIDGLRGDCYYQMKDYSNSLLCYEKQFKLDRQQFTQQKIMRIHSLQLNYKYFEEFIFKGFNLKKPINKLYWDIQSVQNLYSCQIEWSKDQLDFYEQHLTDRINQGYLTDCHHQVNLLMKQKKHPLRQKQLIQLMLQYNPKLAQGYLNQYQYGNLQNEQVNYDDIIQRLMKCDNTVSKYTTLSLILQDKFECQQGINCLQLAIKLNQFDSQVLIQERIIHQQLKNYAQSNNILHQIIKLEDQNSHLMLTLTAPYIKKYQFNQALTILNQIRCNEIIEVHKLLLQLTNYHFFYEQKQQQLENQIQSLSPLYKQLFQGHLNLLKRNHQSAIKFYVSTYQILTELIKLVTLFEKNNELHSYLQSILYQLQYSILLKEDQVLKMSHLQLSEEIIKLSAYHYTHINSNQNYGHIKFKQSLAQLFVNIVYHQNQVSVCEWINQNTEFSIPYMADFTREFFQILQVLYGTDDKYSEVAELQLKKLRSQFTSFQQCFTSISQHLEQTQFQQEINNIINIQLDPVLFENHKKIWQNEYFYDPFSKVALNFLIKVIAYFIEFEDDWRGLFIGGSAEGYYRAIVLWKRNNQN